MGDTPVRTRRPHAIRCVALSHPCVIPPCIPPCHVWQVRTCASGPTDADIHIPVGALTAKVDSVLSEARHSAVPTVMSPPVSTVHVADGPSLALISTRQPTVGNGSYSYLTVQYPSDVCSSQNTSQKGSPWRAMVQAMYSVDVALGCDAHVHARSMHMHPCTAHAHVCTCTEVVLLLHVNACMAYTRHIRQNPRSIHARYACLVLYALNGLLV